MISVCLMSLHQVKSLLNGHSLSNENYLNDCGRFNQMPSLQKSKLQIMKRKQCLSISHRSLFSFSEKKTLNVEDMIGRLFQSRHTTQYRRMMAVLPKSVSVQIRNLFFASFDNFIDYYGKPSAARRCKMEQRLHASGNEDFLCMSKKNISSELGFVQGKNVQLKEEGVGECVIFFFG